MWVCVGLPAVAQTSSSLCVVVPAGLGRGGWSVGPMSPHLRLWGELVPPFVFRSFQAGSTCLALRNSGRLSTSTATRPDNATRHASRSPWHSPARRHFKSPSCTPVTVNLASPPLAMRKMPTAPAELRHGTTGLPGVFLRCFARAITSQRHSSTYDTMPQPVPHARRVCEKS